MKAGPIIVVEDDADDQKTFEEILVELHVPNKVLFFNSCLKAWEYLKETTDQPFIIFSDVNLPKQTGLEFKQRIDEDEYLRRKSIPFIFYSTSADQAVINKAYTTLSVQGFFKKSNSYKEIREDIRLIIDYWKSCRHPNTF
jgi:CheY-like chemotaxis protein